MLCTSKIKVCFKSFVTFITSSIFALEALFKVLCKGFEWSNFRINRTLRKSLNFSNFKGDK